MYTPKELFEEYVAQRQQHIPPDQAFHRLARLRPDLPSDQRLLLAQWVKQWEAQKMQPSHQPPPPAQPMQPPTGQTVICQNCGTPNPVDVKFCYACGLMLSIQQSGATQQFDDDSAIDPSTFGRLSTLIIWIKDAQAPIRLQVDKPQLTVGRSEPPGMNAPDIDFAPYNASAFGVSRRHAQIHWKDNTLSLMDMNSANNTFVNGEKLHPHEVRVVRDGDEVRFGRLVTRFAFHRELRRL